MRLTGPLIAPDKTVDLRQSGRRAVLHVPPTVIRPAVEDDIPAMLAMAEKFVDVAWGRVGVGYDPETSEMLLRKLMVGGILLIDDEQTAMLGAVVHCWPFNRNVLTATELFWWAEPGSRAAACLWEAAEQAAREQGALTFNMACQHHMRADALGRLYTRRGYEPSEHVYIRRLG